MNRIDLEIKMLNPQQNILVTLDGSELAELALREALTLAKLPGSVVTLLQVVPPIEETISDGEEFAVDQEWERRKIGALRYLNGICARPEWRTVHTQVAVEMGNPAETILDFAQRHNIDRIVMASHGRTGLGRWVYGSVADKVLRAADRTVVLVRAGQPLEHLQS
jgi:nucleotide-binding universal stress UspA family protein